MIIEQLIARAKQAPKKIIFTEPEDSRILEAATRCMEENIAKVILIGDVTHATAEVINPKNSPYAEQFAAELFNLRADKGLTMEQARDLVLNNPMYFACMMLRAGLADGIVSGACHSTSDTLRPALQLLKNPETASLVSAFFLMEVPDCQYGENGIFLFSDAGLNQNPSSEELAEIAVDSARSFQQLVGAEPIVAMLSHSTKGSAQHDDVNKITAATQIARERHSELKLDGELQADAALDPRAAELKGASSPVAGHANTLIFPDLDAGNIAYKLVQYLAKAQAFGPITQGLMHPVNDLSRGCTVDDIIGVTAITSIQATESR